MLKITKILAFLLIAVLVCQAFSSCSPSDSYQKKYIFAMDTDVSIYISATRDASELISMCESLIYSIEDVISKTRTGSDVYRLNSGETVECDPITLELIGTARRVASLTGGAFDPTVARLVSLWNACGERDSLPSEAELSEALSAVGLDRVTVDGARVTLAEGAMLDLGGIGKGYAEQAVAELIAANAEKYGVRGYMLDFGGMVGVFGKKASGEEYRIGLKDPNGVASNRGVVQLSSGYVSVSGDYERFVTVGGEKYHHIIDPETGYPAKSGLSSVAVICEDGALADALSTALFVMGYERSLALYESGEFDFEAVFFMDSGEIKVTDGADYTR